MKERTDKERVVNSTPAGIVALTQVDKVVNSGGCDSSSGCDAGCDSACVCDAGGDSGGCYGGAGPD
jgi:hypothetical protein